jgi:hypothetical protein
VENDVGQEIFPFDQNKLRDLHSYSTQRCILLEPAIREAYGAGFE